MNTSADSINFPYIRHSTMSKILITQRSKINEEFNNALIMSNLKFLCSLLPYDLIFKYFGESIPQFGLIFSSKAHCFVYPY